MRSRVDVWKATKPNQKAETPATVASRSRRRGAVSRRRVTSLAITVEICRFTKLRFDSKGGEASRQLLEEIFQVGTTLTLRLRAVGRNRKVRQRG